MLGFLILLLLFAATSASPVRARADYSIKEKFHVPRGWSHHGPAPSDHVINLQIGLKQSQFAELERHLYEVSDPSHERYGQHLSADEVNDLVKPTDQTLDLVHEWLENNGVSKEDLKYSPAKDWIKVSLPVKNVENLLDTKYSVYKHESGGHVVRSPEWSLPHHLHEHIQTIQPTNSFFRVAARKSTAKPILKDLVQPLAHHDFISVESSASDANSADLSSVCNSSYVTPQCLRSYYGTLDYVPQVPEKNKIGIANYLNETSKRSDVRSFLKQFRPDAIPAADTFAIKIINGGDNTQTPNTPEQNKYSKNVEGDLDAETILGIGYPTTLIAYNTGGLPPFTSDASYDTNGNEPYLDWVHYVLNQTDIPQVISTSYGDDEQTVPFSYATAVCQQFAQFGARGVSLLFASGDSGVGTEGYCISNNGANARTFLPSFPDGCPYVTSVGATTGFSPEVAAYDNGSDSLFASGGGFSNYFARPDYQENAVQSYYDAHLAQGTYAGLYNASGRAYPDIAAQGQSFVMTWEGQNIRMDGTSASTPLVAAIISLVNDALIAAGKKPLGFLNPWIYQKGGSNAFHDITSGSAAGCGVDGFKAAGGWDPVTGFGTPNFKAILKNLGL